MGQGWNDIDSDKPKYVEKNQFHSNFVQIYHIPVHEPGTPL
jgi:hypothetical protein